MLRLICCLSLALALPALHAADEEPTPQPAEATATQIEAVHLGIIPDTDTTTFDDTRGVLVKDVEPGNFAASIGIQAGDVITHFNSQPILRIDDLKRALASSRIGNQATITVKRGQELIDFSGALRGKFRPEDISKKREELESLTRAAGTARRARSSDLAQNLRYLAVALNELPDRIEDAAHEFKKVYPKGEFTINIEIRISTNKSKEPATSIKLGEDGEMPEALEQVQPDPAEDPAGDDTPAPVEDAGDDEMPAPLPETDEPDTPTP